MIRVQAGVRWCDIQRFVDPHGLAVKIMQTYANFTVGGALSVNCHGRYVGLGPLVLSVRSLKLVLHDGSVVEASREQHSDLFFGAIGGYGALGVVVEVELDLAENKRVKRTARGDAARRVPGALPQHRAQQSESGVSQRRPLRAALHDGALGHLGRDRGAGDDADPAAAAARVLSAAPVLPLGDLGDAVRQGAAREADRPAALPAARRCTGATTRPATTSPSSSRRAAMHRTYVLQEYFVPVEELENFVPRMAGDPARHRVNALNISIRHAMPDTETMLGWAPRETFAFVLYHKQRTRENAKSRVGVWTRELIDAALAVGGTYYLPYQPHATIEQFHRAYPRAREFFALKWEVDPNFRFTNVLWDKYYRAWLDRSHARGRSRAPERVPPGLRRRRPVGRVLPLPADRLSHRARRPLPPPDRRRLHSGIATRRPSTATCSRSSRASSRFLSDLRYTVPSLVKQKQEMVAQTLAVLGIAPALRGLRRDRLEGAVLRRPGEEARPRRSLSLRRRAAARLLGRPTSSSAAASPGRASTCRCRTTRRSPRRRSPTQASTWSTCYVGLHHMTAERLEPFLASVARILRPGGVFIVRDHDVGSDEMRALVSLAHTVFNAGLGETWETNRAELRFFESADTWVRAPARSRLRRPRPPPAPGQRPDAERAVLLREARRGHQHRREPRPGRVCMSPIPAARAGPAGWPPPLACAAGRCRRRRPPAPAVRSRGR